MLTEEQVFSEVVRPTGDGSTDCRTYKFFYDLNRTRTESYSLQRFYAIGLMGNQIQGLWEKINQTALNPDATYQIESKNIDIIALEFCKVKNLMSSLEVLYSQIELNFKNIKLLEAEYCINPEMPKTESIVFKLTIKGNPKNILKEEDNFYRCIRNLIPIEHRRLFSLVYSVI